MATATFKTIERQLDGTIKVPMTINKNVYNLRPSNFLIASVSGDGVDGISDYYLYGLGTVNDPYKLILDFFDNKEGEVRITASGSVGFESSTEKLTSGAPVSVAYATHVPFIAEYDVPNELVAGEPFIVTLGFNVGITGFGTDDLIFEGISPGMPALYRKHNTTETWNQSSTPPPLSDLRRERDGALILDSDGHPILTTSGWSKGLNPTRGDDYELKPGEMKNTASYLARVAKLNQVGKFFALVFPPVPSHQRGIFDLSLRDNSVRGPDGSDS